MTDNLWRSVATHLEDLRTMLVRMLVAVSLCGVAAFVAKDPIFAFCLAPTQSDFLTYRLLGYRCETVHLINTALMRPLMLHIQTAFTVGCLAALPYCLYQLFIFLAPALYPKEKAYARTIFGVGFLLFLIGGALAYWVLFPLCFRFLASYQVESSIANMITLDSYLTCLLRTALAMGVVFELPILAWALAKAGWLQHAQMVRYRKHAVVGILVLAAVITPTPDVFTLLVAALPIFALYELCILIVRLTTRGKMN
ncbi:MAG: twin-arginine translocase subunit TatC [Paludibacteraceae bacterium]